MSTIAIKNLKFWLLWAGIVALAIFLRFYDLGLRPMHNDEGVNYHFIKGIAERGYYPYSHENYHGPSYFYLLYFTTRLLDYDQFGMRACTSFFGVLTLFLLLPLRARLGDRFVLIAGVLIAISASLVFYSRYAIHETIFLFATFWLAISILLFKWEERPRQLLSCGAALALLVTTKETFIVSLAALFGGVVLALDFPGRFAAVAGTRNLFIQGKSFVITVVRDGLKFISNNWRWIFFSLLLCIVLTLALFSGGFQWFDGLREMLLAIPQWIGRGVEKDPGHFKRTSTGALDYLYYMRTVSLPTESQLVYGIGAVLGFLILFYVPFKDPRKLLSSRFDAVRFFFGWFFASFVAYAVIPYKTPWLVINVVLPGILFLAWWLSEIWSVPRYGRATGVLTMVLALFVGLSGTIYYNFREFNFPGVGKLSWLESRPYSQGNPFSYVHTSDGMIELVRDIEKFRSTVPEPRILIGAGQYWPLPYYLRDMPGNKAYERAADPIKSKERFDVMILNKDQELTDPNWVRKYYRLSDVQESNTYFRIGTGLHP